MISKNLLYTQKAVKFDKYAINSQKDVKDTIFQAFKTFHNLPQTSSQPPTNIPSTSRKHPANIPLTSHKHISLTSCKLLLKEERKKKA